MTGDGLCCKRPHCAPIRAESWVVCPSAADLGLGLRKAAHPYRFQRVKPKAPAAVCLLQPYKHKDTCCLTLVPMLNQSRCLQPNKHKCHFASSLLSFTWFKVFCTFAVVLIVLKKKAELWLHTRSPHNTVKQFKPDRIFHSLLACNLS